MTTNGKKAVQVAVAVLSYENKLLLATRQNHQHEGGKLEFVGGKIEQAETAPIALIREVKEELGLDIGNNTITKLGHICHDYADKSVCLYVYQVKLNDGQYFKFKDKTTGKDGQAIAFYERSWAVGQAKRFPSANRQILRWLTLPPVVVISHELGIKSKEDWLACHQTIAPNSTLLVRTKHHNNSELIMAFIKRRPDVSLVLSLADWQSLCELAEFSNDKVMAIRLTQHELTSRQLPNLPLLPIMVSCHDVSSIQRANELAKSLPVIAIFLSPVKPTKTHPDTSALGWERFGELAKLSDVPVIALGGLYEGDLKTAEQWGAVAVSGIRGFVRG